jgi:hypothetical protein
MKDRARAYFEYLDDGHYRLIASFCAEVSRGDISVFHVKKWVKIMLEIRECIAKAVN